MDIIVDFLNTYSLEFIIGALFLGVVGLIISIIQAVKLKKLTRQHQRLMRGVDDRDLEAIINLYMDKVERALKGVDSVEIKYDELSSQLQTCIQKVAIARYNAFDNVGSNQSYSIALLDEFDNGIVLTGLFGRDSSTTYAKPIKGGKSTHPLTDEETGVIIEAME